MYKLIDSLTTDVFNSFKCLSWIQYHVQVFLFFEAYRSAKTFVLSYNFLLAFFFYHFSSFFFNWSKISFPDKRFCFKQGIFSKRKLTNTLNFATDLEQTIFVLTQIVFIETLSFFHVRKYARNNRPLLLFKKLIYFKFLQIFFKY